MLFGLETKELLIDKIRGLWCTHKMPRTAKIAKKALILKRVIPQSCAGFQAPSHQIVNGR
jgi:hypothetical protein